MPLPAASVRMDGARASLQLPLCRLKPSSSSLIHVILYVAAFTSSRSMCKQHAGTIGAVVVVTAVAAEAARPSPNSARLLYAAPD